MKPPGLNSRAISVLINEDMQKHAHTGKENLNDR